MDPIYEMATWISDEKCFSYILSMIFKSLIIKMNINFHFSTFNRGDDQNQRGAHPTKWGANLNSWGVHPNNLGTHLIK